MTHSGIFLKESRKKLNLGQQEMADKLGVTSQAISQIETGKSDLSKNLLTKLMLTLNINPAYILTGKGLMFFEESESEKTIINELNLTPLEFNILKQALLKDKTLIITLANAIIGDNTAMERIKKLLS
jgi:transcriptional regulator with XRE-family HTH domain